MPQPRTPIVAPAGVELGALMRAGIDAARQTADDHQASVGQIPASRSAI